MFGRVSDSVRGTLRSVILLVFGVITMVEHDDKPEPPRFPPIELFKDEEVMDIVETITGF